jgi:hypothetical protein
MVVTAISCDFDVAGGRDIQRVWAAFLVMFKVNAAWVPSTLVGVAPLLDSNGSVTALQWRLLHDGLTLNEASLPARHGAARNCGMTRTGEIHNSGGEGTNGLGSCRLRSAGNHCSADRSCNDRGGVENQGSKEKFGNERDHFDSQE